MATSAIKVLTDDDDEQDRRRSFYGQLEAFLRRKSNGVVVLPSINGRRIDLYRLYRRVTQLGGWAKVSSAGKWMDVVSATDIGTDCLGAEHGVRTLYMRYLARYEQKQLFGAESDDDEDYPPGAGGGGGSGSGGGGGGSGRTPRVRGSGNHLLLSSPRFMVDATANPRRFGQNGELDLQAVRGSDLMRSLQSGIPVEVDLAVDACVLLSLRPGNLAAMFDLNALIAVLLAHIGIFEDGRVSYRSVYHEAWLRNSGRQFISFWYELVESPELRDLLGPPEVPRMFTRRDLMLGSQVDKEDEILTRMEQVATALLNFSFNPSCVKYLSASKVLFKYILIGVNCSNPQLAVMAFDLLANIADRIKLEPADSLATQLLFETLQAAVYSADRVRLVRALEVLGKLSKSGSSMPLLYELLDEKVVDRLVALLSIKDIMITVGLLECMLMLTESGTVCCDRLVSNNHTISLLVSMLTAEAYSFAPDGLTGLTVLEINVPQPGANSRASSSSAVAASSGAGRVVNARTMEMYPRLPVIGRRPFGPSASPARFARPVMTTAAGRCSPVPNATLLYRPTAPAAGSRMMQPCTGPVYVDHRSGAAAPSGQGRWTESFRGPAVTTCQDQQNEAAAVAWIKENCAADQGSIVSRGELYAVYVRCMTSKNLVALSANIFSNLIRQVFPSCVLRQLSGAGAKSGLMQIEGIRFVTDVKSQHPLMAQMLGSKNAATAAGGVAPQQQQQSALSKPATDCWPLTTTAPGRCDSAGGGGGAGSESSSVSNTPESMCSSSSVGDVSLSSVSAGRQARKGSCKLPPSSSTSTTSVGHLRVPNGSSSSTCQLEICHPAEEATSLIEISGMHEAKIVRVENKALTSPSSSSSSSSSNSVAVGCMLNNNDTSLVVNGQLAAGKLDNEPDGDSCVVNGIGGRVSSNESTASDSGGGAKEEVGILDGTAEYDAPAEGGGGGGTDVESIKQNVTQCQKNIQQLLGSSHSNGCQKRGSGAVGRKRRLNDSSNSNSNACAMPLLAEHLQQQEGSSGGEDIGPAAVKAPYIAGSNNNNNNTDNGCETPPPTSTMVNPTLCAARFGPPNNSAHPPRGPPLTPHPGSLRLNLMCEWNNCGRLFPSAQAVCNHVYHEHIGDVSQQCKWANCDNTVRLKWSLVAHVQDVHCNEYALRAAAVRRYELATTGQSSIPEIRPPPPHPGYAPDAAMAAIRRHSLVNLPKDVTEENEGPVTKNIRITSALILRNMARHSAEARRRLKSHVRHLAYLACSKLDCHRVLEQCLAAIDEPEAEEEGGGLECVPS